MSAYLISRIQELDRRLADLAERAADIERERTITLAQREAYQDALDHSPVATPETKKHGRAGVRSGAWREVVKFIASRSPHPVTNDQMMAHILGAGLSLSRQALRAQLSTYTHKGALERVGDGHYRITLRGREELAFADPEMEAATDSPSVAAPELSSAERA